MNDNLNINLINLRKSKNLSVERFAELLKVDTEQMKKWEFGMEIPALEDLEKIAKFYGMSASDLFLPVSVPAQLNAKTATASSLPSTARTGYKFSPGIAISILSLTAVLFVLFFLPTYAFSVEYYFSVDYTYAWVSCNAGETFYTVTFVFMLLTIVWDIISLTLHLVFHFSKKNAYVAINATVSKVFLMITAILMFFMFLGVHADVTDIGFELMAAGVISVLVYIAIMVLKIVLFAKIKNKKQ